jgi:outer membrane lipoprotein-sorting protein
MKMRITLVALLLPVLALLACAQDASKRPSPAAEAQCKFSDGKTVKSDYSSPRAKGRKIFGGLVPYGEVWRAGDNDATTLVKQKDLRERS